MAVGKEPDRLEGAGSEGRRLRCDISESQAPSTTDFLNGKFKNWPRAHVVFIHKVFYVPVV